MQPTTSRVIAMGAGLVLLGLAWVVDVPAPEPAAEPADLILPPARSRGDGPFLGLSGGLAGLVVYLSAGHGWVWHRRGEGWQRPESNELREDLWTAVFATEALVPALERAGATVLTVRERDPRPLAVVRDAASAELAGFVGWERAPELPGIHRTELSLAGHSAAVLEAGGRAEWELVAPASGRWQVYGWWLSEPTAGDVAWEVCAPACALVEVGTGAHGGSWWPLVPVEVDAGQLVRVRATSGTGAVVGGVRLGGGVLRAWDPRRRRYQVRPAWELAAVHQLPLLGTPRWADLTEQSGFDGDAAVRPRWAAWAHPEGEDAVYLSIHSDAGGGRGTVAVVRQKAWSSRAEERVLRSHRLADALREGMVGAVRSHVVAEWADRGTLQENLAELSDAYNDEMPAVLLEVGFHDRPEEAAHLADPGFRSVAAAGLVAGLASWWGAEPPPAPPVVRLQEGEVRWEPGPVEAPWGPAQGWQVRERRGDGWSAPRWVLRTRWHARPDALEVEVVALGPGGRSRPVRLEVTPARAQTGR